MIIEPEPFEMWKLLCVFLIFISISLLVGAFVIDSFRKGVRSWGISWILLTFVGMSASMIPVVTMVIIYLHVLLFQIAPVSAGIIASAYSLISYFIFYDSIFLRKTIFQ